MRLHFLLKALSAVLCAIFFFVSGSFALDCKGTVYFKKPNDWSRVYLAGGALFSEVKENYGSGWYVAEADIAARGSTFRFTNNASYYPVKCVTDAGFNLVNLDCQFDDEFSCDDFNGKDALYIFEHPTELGKTVVSNDPPDIKYFHVMIPETEEWQMYPPKIRAEGEDPSKGTLLIPDENHCGWFYAVFFNVEPPENVIVYNDNGEEFGIKGLNASDVSLIPLRQVFEDLQTQNLFFIPDDSYWYGYENGWSVEYPEVEGQCTYNLATLIYDTDVSLNSAFVSFDGKQFVGPYADGCLGVHTDIVKSLLGDDGKPQLNVGSENAIKCFGNNPELFNSLFNYTKGVNEVVCHDMEYTRARDGRWTYDSENLIVGNQKGGFFPVENTTDNDAVYGPLPDVRMKSEAMASVPVLYKDFEHYCNTAGWSGGVECEGLFDSGLEDGVYDWSYTPWKENRNQYFCAESHARFTYSRGSTFSVIGDGDVWVFVDGKLVVDNGGGHLPAPGFVDLDRVTGKSGNTLEEGKKYTMDIFKCSRFETRSTIAIKTNLYMTQSSSGIEISKGEQNVDGSTSYDICWTHMGSGSCADVALSSINSDSRIVACGSDIQKYSADGIKYTVQTRQGDVVLKLSNGKVNLGGIDLTNPYAPIINESKIRGIAPGSYKLEVSIGSQRKLINFRVKSNIAIASKAFTYNPWKGDEVSQYYSPGTKWNFVDKAMAGTRVPVYISSIADGEIDLLSAVSQSYTLSAYGVNFYAKENGSERVFFPRTINNSGIDTIWVEKPLGSMKGEVEHVELFVGFSSAKIDFYAPQLKFIRNGKFVTGDPELDENKEPYFNWVGSYVDLQVAIVNPINGKICDGCNADYKMAQSDGSAGVASGVFSTEKGIATVRVVSNKTYYPDETAFITIAFIENDLIAATYENMRFRVAPGVYPVLAELFDTRGSTSAVPFKIPAPYYFDYQEYLDGIADSLVISYNRRMGRNALGEVSTDSIPQFICLNWDDENTFDFVKYGTTFTCSDTIGVDEIVEAVTNSSIRTRTDANTGEIVEYDVLKFGGRNFSRNVKTGDDGIKQKYVSSVVIYMEGKIQKILPMKIAITDRIAPVILKAESSVNSNNSNYYVVELCFSEPVKLKENADGTRILSYYLNSAGTVNPDRYPSDDSRYLTLTSLKSVPVDAEFTTEKIGYSQGVMSPVPQDGDYVRFANDAIEDLYGNSPTDYNVELPSPWTLVIAENVPDFSSSSGVPESSSSSRPASSSSIPSISSSSSYIPSSSSSIPDYSSSSAIPGITSSSSDAMLPAIPSTWQSTNATFNSTSADKVVIGSLIGTGLRTVTMNVNVVPGGKYVLEYTVSVANTTSAVPVGTRVLADGQSVVSGVINATSNATMYRLEFVPTSNVVTVALVTTTTDGVIVVDNFSVKDASLTGIHVARNRQFKAFVSGKSLKIVAATNSPVYVQIFDMMGNLVENKIVNVSAGEQAVPLERLSRGSYVVKAYGDRSAATVTRISIR